MKKTVAECQELLAEWDFERNTEDPEILLLNSNKKVWWRCFKGHEWQARVAARNPLRTKHRPTGCPYCTEKKVISGENDFKTVYPDIAAEWHPEKNKPVSPSEIAPRSGKKFWWLCPICGLEWQATVHTRTKGEGCPRCALTKRTSRAEQVLYFYIQRVFPDTINSYRPEWMPNMEVDIFIPSLKLAIEYDGVYWHKNVERDKKKNDQLKDNGIKVVRIRERGLPSMTGADCIIQTERYDKNPDCIYSVLKAITDYMNKIYNLSICIDADLVRDNQKIKEMSDKNRQGKSIALARPDLIEEWHPNNNGLLDPNNVNKASHVPVWWKCSVCGYEWETAPANRYSLKRGSNCPNCSRQSVNRQMQQRNLVIGKTDLVTTFPEVVKEWDYEKNGTDPSRFTANSNKTVWWKCSKGHEWQAKIASRTRGSGCPICSNHRVLPGYNDLGTINPSLACELCDEMNNGVTAAMVTPRSSKKLWWKCPDCGYIWKTSVQHRASGQGCPKCANRKKGRKKNKGA